MSELLPCPLAELLDRTQGGTTTDQCLEATNCPHRRTGTGDVVALKAFISTILQEAVSGWDANGRRSKYCDQSNFIRWGSVEEDIHKRIDSVLANPVPTASELVEYLDQRLMGSGDYFLVTLAKEWLKSKESK